MQQVADLQGIAPNRLVGFAFHYGMWQQVPIQVDERAVLDLSKPKNARTSGRTTLFYTDPNTWTGADPDATFDANDEVAFMARDMYGTARSIDDDERDVHYTLSEPPHVVPGSGVQVRVSDPLVADSGSWMYLFESDGTLDPAAGRAALVNYQFVLLSGNYKSTYKISAGPNPENSTVTTSRYSAHFADRWVHDELWITAGNATNVDILDVHKSGFAGNCGRSEATFSRGPGAFIANKSGPVRAIRSYLGANSGTYTQRDEIMYEGRMDVTTHLRVHAIPPLRDWMDYSAAAVRDAVRHEHEHRRRHDRRVARHDADDPVHVGDGARRARRDRAHEWSRRRTSPDWPATFVPTTAMTRRPPNSSARATHSSTARAGRRSARTSRPSRTPIRPWVPRRRSSGPVG